MKAGQVEESSLHFLSRPKISTLNSHFFALGKLFLFPSKESQPEDMKLGHHFLLLSFAVFSIITLFALVVLLYFFQEIKFTLVNFIIELIFIVTEGYNFDVLY